jgi:dihydrofolate reductase
MRTIAATMFVTLDGVVQGPGRPDEDTRGGFPHGGWTLPDADAWENSTLLPGEAASTVAELKASPGPDLAIVGSTSLVRGLHEAGLIDRYTLLIHPLTLGRGARLFEQPGPLTEFELTGTVITGKGVIIAHYAHR